MIVDNRRSPIEDEDQEDPFWENLYEKYPIIEDAIFILPWVEKAVEYILDEGRKQGVSWAKEDMAAEAEYEEWLRHKELVEMAANGIKREDEAESPSELHVRQQEWRDKHHEKWMDDKPGDEE